MTRAQEHAVASLLLVAIGIALLHFTGSRDAAGAFFGFALVDLAFLAWTIIAERRRAHA